MKASVCVFLLFMCCTASVAQKTYAFDYYTVYEYSKNEKSRSDSRELTYSNTTDPNIHLIALEDGGKVFQTYLVDKNNERYYEFDSPASFSEMDSKALKVVKSSPMNLSFCKKKENFYELSNIQDTVRIKRFKNEKKSKLINEAIVVVAPTSITKLQKYNFGPFRNPLWCGKYGFDKEVLITYSYFVEKGKKVHFRKLAEIKQVNFTVTVPTKDDTKK